MDAPSQLAKKKKPRPLDPFRRAIIRGLGVLLPPLLTVVIILWVWNTVANYLLVPMESAARQMLYDHYQDEILPASTRPDETVEGIALIDGEAYRRAGDGQFVLADHYDEVVRRQGLNRVPPTAEGVYRVYIDQTFLQRHIVVPVFLSLFLLMLYLIGKFLAAGVGRLFWTQFERLITRLPFVRNVYSSVKQVTDFLFSEQELEYTRVVAIEYPRKGIWSLAFVTGDGMQDVASAANEGIMSVLVPTSPMPLTGFTIMVKKSESVDLDITVEQALQFIVSCGVVTPPQQMRAPLPAGEPQQRALPPYPG